MLGTGCGLVCEGGEEGMEGGEVSIEVVVDGEGGMEGDDDREGREWVGRRYWRGRRMVRFSVVSGSWHDGVQRSHHEMSEA